MEKIASPANRPGKTDSERKRIPMSVPVQTLEAPDIPGYHLHWFRGDDARISRALAAGYEFVHDSEIKPNAVGLGGNSTQSGNTDMGSRVSVVGGKEVGRDGQPLRMILMKIKEELYNEDQQLVVDRNEQVAAALRGGLLGSDQDRAGDTQHRYIDKSRTSIPDLFNPNKRKRLIQT